MLRRSSWLVPVVGGALAAVVAWAQLPLPPAPIDETPTFTTETREVMLHVSVLDKNERLITDIPRSAFTVYENDQKQQIKIFRREDVPVSMCILIDSSGSMKDKFQSVTAAALALVRASNPDDEVCFVNFNDEAYLDQPLTNNVAKLEEAMSRMDSRGSTAMRNAISGAIDYLKKDGKREKKVIVVVTDGNDNSSELKIEDLVSKVRDSEVLVYLIGLLNEESRSEARRAKRALEDLAEASGGLDYYPESLEEVKEVTPIIAHEIRNQYTIAYTPTNEALDGTYRRVKVEVKGVGKHTVRHRPGYFAGGAPAKPSGDPGRASNSANNSGVADPK